jgi:hypothetical protein
MVEGVREGSKREESTTVDRLGAMKEQRKHFMRVA